MSKVSAFLQKRRMHRSRHSLHMIIMAYVLSFLLLFFGSDALYNIRTEATDIQNEKDEESKSSNKVNKDIMTARGKTQIIQASMINPYQYNNDIDNIYQIKEIQQAYGGESILQGTDHTYWLLGYSLDNAGYSELIHKIESTYSFLSKEQVKQDVLAGTKVNTVESFSVDETKIKSKVLDVTDKELKLLERIVEAEAGGEDMTGKILIANVVFNRVSNDKFPDTINEVIYQKVGDKYQFSPVSGKRFKKLKISEKSQKAVERALEGEDYSEGALYFMARKRSRKNSVNWFDENLKWLFRHGGHEFFK